MRPLGFGELLDAGFRLWRNNFGKLFVIGIAIDLPLAVVTFLVDVSYVVDVEDGILFVDEIDTYNSISVVLVLVSLFVTAITFSALFAVAVPGYIGEERTVGEALGDAFRRVLPFIGLAIMFYFMVLIGFFLLVIGAIFFGVSYALAPAVFWGEKETAYRSMARSWRLVGGRRWPIFGLLFVGGLLVSVVSSLAGAIAIAALFVDSVTVFLLINTIITVLISAAVTPFIPCLITAIYYDARVRKEGFDIELAARQLDLDDGDEGAPPPDPLIR